MMHYTAAQIEAILELEGGSQRLIPAAELAQMREHDKPTVMKGCICPPNHEGKRHEPDRDGYLHINPSCEEHGLHSRFIPRSRLTQYDCRTMGVIHSRKGN
jgi:hypothetical protein